MQSLSHFELRKLGVMIGEFHLPHGGPETLAIANSEVQNFFAILRSQERSARATARDFSFFRASGGDDTTLVVPIRIRVRQSTRADGNCNRHPAETNELDSETRGGFKFSRAMRAVARQTEGRPVFKRHTREELAVRKPW